MGGAVAKVHSQPDPRISQTGYTSAKICGDCHVDIYNSWKNSLHGFSLSDPIFDGEYMTAIKEEGEKARAFCLRCHAPMTRANEDYQLKKGVTREGVSCDFCHTVVSVDLTKKDEPYELDPGPVKRSVLKKAASPAHEVAYSKLHETSEFCGGCHNYSTPAGAPILSTYDEWREGPVSKEGTQCQDCHMELSPGNVVNQSVKKSKHQIHLHSLIHDAEQLTSALTMKIAQLRREESRLYVAVDVTNSGSGHKVPTGMPTREVVLTVSVDAGGRVRTQTRSYRKEVVDAEGKPIQRDYQALLWGAGIRADNRISPRERRREQFWFHVPREGALSVTTRLTYNYRPWIQRVEPIDIELAASQRTIR